MAKRFLILFYYAHFLKDNDAEGEQKQLDLPKKYNVDVIVLGHY